MTANKTIYKKRRSFSSFASIAMICFIFALFFRNSEIAIEYIKKGLLLCASTIIPSLFPFMVLSDIAVSAGLGDLLAKYLRTPMRRLFGISGEGACALLLGFLCGFPVGAKSAISLYEGGRITRSECERLIPLCSVPSIAFCVNVVGVSVFQSSRAGWLFWLSSLLSSVITGILGNALASKKAPPSNAPPLPSKPPSRSRPSDLVRAVEGSTRAVLIVCGYVIFFSALMGTLSAPLDFFSVPYPLKTLICGALELTTGASLCKDIPSLTVRTALCALFIGWSGLSVHFQIFSICEGKGIDFKKYLFVKLFHGLICIPTALLLIA